MGAKISRRHGKSQRRFDPRSVAVGDNTAGFIAALSRAQPRKRKEAGHYSGLNENKRSKNF
jgi:hypothetical protein